PRTAEDQRDLFEVVHEKLFRVLMRVGRSPRRREDFRSEHFLQFLRERRLGHTSPANAQQLDLVVERRILTIVERTHYIMRSGKCFITVELPSLQTDQ